MKKILIYFFAITFSVFISCKSDQSGTQEISEESVENLAEDFLEEELSMVNGENEVSEDSGTVGNEVEVQLEEVVVDKEKELAEKKAILKEQLKESPNLGKDCESILKEYGSLVDKYVSGEDKESVIKQLAAWANDPIFNKCKKSEEYKNRFFDLEERMYADEDEDL